MSISEKTNKKLWEQIKKKVTASDKGGRPGQWSARKAQIASKLYREAGGGYVGPKSRSNALQKWTDQEWQYVGKPKKSRYLPKKAIDKLTPQEKKATNRAKLLGTKRGKQYVPQPKKVAKKVAKYRK